MLIKTRTTIQFHMLNNLQLMKKLITAITFLLIIGQTTTVSAQEEFFGNRDGFSLSYSSRLKQDENSFGASLYLKNKVIVGLNMVSAYNRTYPFFSLLACPHWGDNLRQLKLGYGITYGYVEENHIIGLNLLFIQPFLAGSKFPLSIQGSVAVSTALNKYDNSQFNLYPAIGLGYTQAFFAGGQVYPLIGLSYAHDLNAGTDQVMAHAGINIKLGKAETDR